MHQTLPHPLATPKYQGNLCIGLLVLDICEDRIKATRKVYRGITQPAQWGSSGKLGQLGRLRHDALPFSEKTPKTQKRHAARAVPLNLNDTIDFIVCQVISL